MKTPKNTTQLVAHLDKIAAMIDQAISGATMMDIAHEKAWGDRTMFQKLAAAKSDLNMARADANDLNR